MDPNETLQRIREARDTCEALEPQQRVVRLALLDELAANFDALDTWLVRGGFLPRNWQCKRKVQP